MLIRLRNTEQVITESEFRSLHKNSSFPQQLTESIINSFNADIVFEGPQASVSDIYHYSQYAGVENINGKWYTKYVEGPTDLTEEQWQERIASIDDQTKQSNKQQAINLLKETDWSETPSVSDITRTPHLLNSEDFISYREQLRAIAVNPPVTVETWPTLPTEEWSS